MNIEHDVKGLDELINKLAQLSDVEHVNSVVKSALLKGGVLVQATAKLNCHVDTGQLRNSIEVSELENGVDIGTNVPQAIFEEYGTGRQGDPTVSHTTKEKWRYQDEDGNWHTTSGHPPHPFLYPALLVHKQNIKDEVKNAVANDLKGR